MSEYKIDYCHHDSLTAQNTYSEDVDEYIKRGDAIKAINGQFMTGIVKDIMAIPAADVKPVRHGHWNRYGPSFAPWQCSECEYDTRLKENYCPNCGIKMDGDEE